MNQSRTFCIAGSTDTGDHGSHTGTDILSMMIGTAAPKLTAPVVHNACRIPTDAEDDWITAVRIMPASTPKTGFWNSISRLVNSGTSASGETAALMESMPNIRIAKPTRMVAAFFNLSLWENSKIPTPTIAKSGKKNWA